MRYAILSLCVDSIMDFFLVRENVISLSHDLYFYFFLSELLFAILKIVIDNFIGLLH